MGVSRPTPKGVHYHVDVIGLLPQTYIKKRPSHAPTMSRYICEVTKNRKYPETDVSSYDRFRQPQLQLMARLQPNAIV